MKKWIFASVLSACALFSHAHALNSHPQTDPAFNNLRYHYYVQTPRFLNEDKILSAFKKRHHSYAPPSISDQVKQAYNIYKTPKKFVIRQELLTQA